jgi:hypothetical protein
MSIEQAIAYVDTMHQENRIEEYEYETIRDVLADAYDKDWVDAHENPPEKDGEYLVYTERGHIKISEYHKIGLLNTWGTPDGYFPDHVDYWRLLPDVPCSD